MRSRLREGEEQACDMVADLQAVTFALPSVFTQPRFHEVALTLHDDEMVRVRAEHKLFVTCMRSLPLFRFMTHTGDHHRGNK